MRARVFLSCGQSAEAGEVEIATAIAQRLEALGFDTYIAVQEQSLRGLVENIYSRLRESEYFVFVDFKRELLVDSGEHRGSLSSHQELAIASFSGLEVLAFQEKGVRLLDGIMRFLQANAIYFTDRHLLASVIADKVVSRHWRADWRCVLQLKRDPKQYKDATVFGDSRYDRGQAHRFFHGAVHNQHHSQPAVHTYIYLERITPISTGIDQAFKAAEIKWAGYTYPNALVRPGEHRLFDCCHVAHDQPTIAQFNVFADSTEYIPFIHGPGDFQLRFTVFADHFASTSIDLRLTLGDAIDNARLEVMA